MQYKPQAMTMLMLVKIRKLCKRLAEAWICIENIIRYFFPHKLVVLVQLDDSIYLILRMIESH